MLVTQYQQLIIHTCLVVAGSSHRQSVEVHEVPSRILTPAIIAYSIAAIWEQASPAPAMQLQCAQIIVPSGLIPAHGFSGGLLILWLCLTFKKFIYIIIYLPYTYLCCHKKRILFHFSY